MFTSTTHTILATIVITLIVGVGVGIISMMSYAPSVSGPSKKIIRMHKEAESVRIQYVKNLLEKGTAATDEEMTGLLEVSLNYLVTIGGGLAEAERPSSIAVFYKEWESLLQGNIIDSNRLVRDPAMVRENIPGIPLSSYVLNNGGYEHYYREFAPELAPIIKKHSLYSSTPTAI